MTLIGLMRRLPLVYAKVLGGYAIFLVCEWTSKFAEFELATLVNGRPFNVVELLYRKIYVNPSLFLGWEYSSLKPILFIYPLFMYFLIALRPPAPRDGFVERLAVFTFIIVVVREIDVAMIDFRIAHTFEGHWGLFPYRLAISCLCGLSAGLLYRRYLQSLQAPDGIPFEGQQT